MYVICLIRSKRSYAASATGVLMGFLNDVCRKRMFVWLGTPSVCVYAWRSPFLFFSHHLFLKYSLLFLGEGVGGGCSFCISVCEKGKKKRKKNPCVLLYFFILLFFLLQKSDLSLFSN